MKVCNISLVSGIVLVLLVVIVSCGKSSSPTEPQARLIGFFSLDPRATYLHTCSDYGAVNATPLLLSDLDLVPGDQIRLEAVGNYNNGNVEKEGGRIAVFSSSETLLGAGESHRVPDAIDAGEDFDTGETYFCDHEATDIPEDFGFEPETSVTIPVGATHLFICVTDSYYEDNSDDDNDFGVNIYILE
jgi:hypothetical protein